MEGLYLLASIVSTSVTTFTLSLLLPFQYIYFLLRRISSSTLTTKEGEGVIRYEGSVWHERKRPVHHAFQYSVRYALLDLDRAFQTTLPPSLFHNHLSAHQARQISNTTGPVFLLTIPPSVGYEQNPLSVYYCYDLEGTEARLKKCIAEVTNTPWGERVSFLFHPNSDLVAKPLHVSPFMTLIFIELLETAVTKSSREQVQDMLGNWSMRANAPGDNLFLAISVQHPKLGDYFTATLTAKRVSSSFDFGPDFFFWLMPQKVALWIYWQALKLWWKNVRFMQHPKYFNPMYRGEAIMRNRKLQSCHMFNGDENVHPKFDNGQSDRLSDGNNGHRWCVWRDAQWPWT